MQLPTLEELVDLADDRARAVLRVASRLAAWRHRAASISAADRAPAGERIVRADLLGAILASAPDVLREIPSNLTASPIDPVLLGEAHAWWSARLADSPGDGLTRLGPWVRQLVLDWQRPATRTVAHLLGCVGWWGIRELRTLSRDWIEGLRTGGEIVGAYFDAGLVKSADHVFPLYVDRHDGLRQLGSAFTASDGLGALVIGDDGCGRHALVTAYLQQLQFGDSELARKFRYAGTLYWLSTARSNELLFYHSAGSELFAFREGVEHGRLALDRTSGYTPGWVHDVPVLVEDAIADPARVRLIVVTTEADLPAVVAAHPAIARLRRVEVPQPAPRDWLPIWFAQVPVIEAFTERRVTLAEVLAAFAASTDRERACGVWTGVLEAVLRVEADALAEIRWDHHPESRQAPWQRLVRKVKRGRPPDDDEQVWIERWLGDVDGLRALIAADAALRDP